MAARGLSLIYREEAGFSSILAALKPGAQTDRAGGGWGGWDRVFPGLSYLGDKGRRAICWDGWFCGLFGGRGVRIGGGEGGEAVFDGL